MNGKKTKELRRIAQEIAAREGIKDGLFYKTHGLSTKKINAIDNQNRPIFDEVDGKKLKRQITVIGYTRECLGVRGIYLALKKAYGEALSCGDRRPLREIFAEDLAPKTVEIPATKTIDVPKATTLEDMKRAESLMNDSQNLSEVKEAA